MEGKAGLKVGSLVLVYDVGLGQLVQHFLDAREKLHSLVLVSKGAELAHGVAHGLCVIFVVKSALLVLADSLQC